jgi:hypothetical protein
MTRPDHTAVPPADVIAAAEAPFAVAEFWSSANPGKKVRMLAEGKELAEWPKRGDFIRWVQAPGAAPTAAQAAGRSVAYRCPSGCGCLWRDNNDGTMSLLDGRQKSCPVCERMPLRELESMAIADHLFIDCRDDGVWLVCVEKIHRSEDEARSSCRQWKAAYGNASHAPNATLAASRDAKSATSGATSAAKVEVPAGWKLVPIETTGAMDKAGREALRSFFGAAAMSDDAEACYREMLRAAPKYE